MLLAALLAMIVVAVTPAAAKQNSHHSVDGGVFQTNEQYVGSVGFSHPLDVIGRR